ncbi:MAG: hypothetical protein IPK59_13910 [Rhodospirillaceae bacterium]|nr:hypothetical protein [Rhodospirillaceae bacterium]
MRYEARAIAMMGGRRVVRVTRVTDAVEPAFAALLADHKDGAQCLVVIEAGDVDGIEIGATRFHILPPILAATAASRGPSSTSSFSIWAPKRR